MSTTNGQSGPRIFLGMPNYGQADMRAARSFFMACRDSKRFYKYHPRSSLLANNFNGIWCAALNYVHDGGQLDYFAMLHSDVAPEDYWLDTLIDELKANDLDMLAAAVPINDTRGLTSMALASSDEWQPFCRLSMHDVHFLPPTFTSDDLGGKLLLLNTGCWVIRWNQEAFGERPDSDAQLVPICGPHFQIRDRIIFNRSANCYQAQTEPEDWNWSRQMHERGLRIGATRKIHLNHYGGMGFPNYAPFGDELFDYEANLKESPVPKIDREGFRFPRDVEGWLSYDEGKALWRLARNRRVLEIGSYLGLSTICLAQSAAEVTSVDPHDGRGTAIPQSTFDRFIANLQRYDVRGKVRAMVGTLADDLTLAGPFDLVFIDGAHDYDSVQDNIAEAIERLAPNGLLAFHDYHSPRDPDVTKAVDELVNDGGELLSTTNTLAVVRPPAAILLEV